MTEGQPEFEIRMPNPPAGATNIDALAALVGKGTRGVLDMVLRSPGGLEQKTMKVIGWSHLDIIARLAQQEVDDIQLSPEKGLIMAMIGAIQSKDLAALRVLATQSFSYAKNLRTALTFFTN